MQHKCNVKVCSHRNIKIYVKSLGSIFQARCRHISFTSARLVYLAAGTDIYKVSKDIVLCLATASQSYQHVSESVNKLDLIKYC